MPNAPAFAACVGGPLDNKLQQLTEGVQVYWLVASEGEPFRLLPNGPGVSHGEIKGAHGVYVPVSARTGRRATHTTLLWRER